MRCVVGGGRSVVAAFRNAGEPATQAPHVEVYPPAGDDEAVGEESVAVSKEQEEVAH